MSGDKREALETALKKVKSSRRELLKRLLVGGGAMALLAPISKVLAAPQTGTGTAAPGKGKGKGKARKGKGKGKGKARTGKPTTGTSSTGAPKTGTS